MDFHGDGQPGDVQIVGAYRKLHLPWASEHRREHSLAATDSGSSHKPAPCSLVGSDAEVHRASYLMPLLAPRLVGGPSRDGRGLAESLRLGETSWPHAAIEQAAAYGSPRHAQLIRKALLRDARRVTPDDVVGIEVDHWAGHVYNLSTAGGWYGIADADRRGGRSALYPTSNCQCSLRYILDSEE